MKKFLERIPLALAMAIWTALVNFFPAFAHEGVTGDEWLMADWMLFSFLIFFGAGLVAFVIALKRGYLNNLEDAKYHILSIEEPDYYTPDWVKEDEDDTDRQ